MKNKLVLWFGKRSPAFFKLWRIPLHDSVVFNLAHQKDGQNQASSLLYPKLRLKDFYLFIPIQNLYLPEYVHEEGLNWGQRLH